MKRRSVGKSHPGNVRKNNEDYFAINDPAGFTVVADGMGGHAAGEVASKISVDTACAVLALPEHSPLKKILRPFKKTRSSFAKEEDLVTEAIKEGNGEIRKKIQTDSSLKGMGTTICIVKSFNSNKEALIGYAGDSRVYRFRGLHLEQLSEDDSVVREQLAQNLISPEEAERSPFKHILTKALGADDDISPGTGSYEVLDNDIFLSCTDGLTDMLKDSEIEGILSKTKDIRAAVDALITLALEKGGKDNVSVVLTQFTS